MLAVEGVIDLLTETGAHLRLVAVANGFQQQILEAVAFKDFTEDVEDLALEAPRSRLRSFSSKRK